MTLEKLIKKTGGGTFDPQEGNIYFIAANVERLNYGMYHHDHILVAVNEINSPKDEIRVKQWLKDGKKVFLDSGVFNLAMTHARKHNISMDIALSAPPDEIDGFDKLFEKYVGLVQQYADQLWGYIEIDQGGRENKIKTRARLDGYLAENKVLGLSKFARIAHKIAHRLQLQEQLVFQIASELSSVLNHDNIAVLGSGEHLCMTMRGIKTPALMKSVVMKYLFKMLSFHW